MKIAVAAACVVVFGACGIDDREQPPAPMKARPLAESVPPIAETAPARKAHGWDATTTTGMSGEDQAFVSAAAMRALAEVKMGNLVLDKGTHAEVRTFAWRMVTDYSSMKAQVARLAGAKGLAVPTELGGEQRSSFNRLSALTGEEFDKAYMQHMAGTEPGMAPFERASTSAEDADVKAFALSALSMLRHHVPMAKEAADTFQRDLNRVIKIQ